MSPNPEKAVAVAKDVLDRLDAIHLRRQRYFSFYRRDYDLPREGDLQQHLNEVQDNCSVCVLGACILSKTKLYDEVPMFAVASWREDGVEARYSIRETLQDIFDRDTLDLMETAFEGERLPWSHADYDLETAAKTFGYERSSLKKVVRDVMLNIIANHGAFRPDKAVAGKET